VIALGPSRLTRIIVCLFFIHPAGALGLQASGHEGWSVDLKNYGYKEWRNSRSLFESSETALVVANNVVAVALGNPSNATQTSVQSDAYGTNWEISLLLLDAATGKLNSQRGPWSGDHFFELFSTSRGNLLLLLRHAGQDHEEIGETLLLLSPNGDELKKLELSPSVVRSRKTWNRFLISSSGRTMLLEQTLEDGVHCKLLDTDTLAVQSEWAVEQGANLPSIIALSDKEFLGLGPPKGSRRPGAPQEGRDFFVRSFAGAWDPFPASLDLSQRFFTPEFRTSQLAFLSDDTIVGINVKRQASESPLVVSRSDGSNVFSPAIPKLEANTSLTGPVSVTPDGRYFAVGFTHRPWLSHLMLDVWKLDDTFANDELVLVIWASGQPTSVAKINMGDEYNVRSFSLAFDDPPSLVCLGGNTLKSIPIQLHR
jgi:hypothetical protein